MTAYFDSCINCFMNIFRICTFLVFIVGGGRLFLALVRYFGIVRILDAHRLLGLYINVFGFVCFNIFSITLERMLWLGIVNHDINIVQNMMNHQP